MHVKSLKLPVHLARMSEEKNPSNEFWKEISEEEGLLAS